MCPPWSLMVFIGNYEVLNWLCKEAPVLLGSVIGTDPRTIETFFLTAFEDNFVILEQLIQWIEHFLIWLTAIITIFTHAKVMYLINSFSFGLAFSSLDPSYYLKRSIPSLERVLLTDIIPYLLARFQNKTHIPKFRRALHHHTLNRLPITIIPYTVWS